MSVRGKGLRIELLWQADGSAEPLGGRGPGGQATGRARGHRPGPTLASRGGALPPELAARFEGDLSIPLRPERPTIVSNFVSSLDGVVALGPTEHSTGGGEISGHSDPDIFHMALLRCLADVVVVGAGTVRVGRNHEWTARKLYPELDAVFAGWRTAMGLAPQPTTVVVSASGRLDFAHAGLSAPDVPVIVATTTAGARTLGTDLPHNARVVVAGQARVTPAALVEIVAGAGAQLALCEGGPHLLGGLAAANRLDEIFLTAAPQLIGRPAGSGRLALVEGVDLFGADPGWAGLISVRRAGDDLFLRYRFDR